MRMNPKQGVVAAMIVAGLLGLPAHGETGGGKGGDEFRKTAVEYEASAGKSAQAAAGASGDAAATHSDLAAVYREMAMIKRNAADLADQNRWKEISWERYHELGARRDKLRGMLAPAHAKK